MNAKLCHTFKKNCDHPRTWYSASFCWRLGWLYEPGWFGKSVESFYVNYMSSQPGSRVNSLYVISPCHHILVVWSMHQREKRLLEPLQTQKSTSLPSLLVFMTNHNPARGLKNLHVIRNCRIRLVCRWSNSICLTNQSDIRINLAYKIYPCEWTRKTWKKTLFWKTYLIRQAFEVECGSL